MRVCALQATGTPCRIHCSEGVYRAVSAVPSSPVVWEKPHTTFAKGFGTLQTYFVRVTHASPPKDLLVSLMLEPHLVARLYLPLSLSSVRVQACDCI